MSIIKETTGQSKVNYHNQCDVRGCDNRYPHHLNSKVQGKDVCPDCHNRMIKNSKEAIA